CCQIWRCSRRAASGNHGCGQDRNGFRCKHAVVAWVLCGLCPGGQTGGCAAGLSGARPGIPGSRDCRPHLQRLVEKQMKSFNRRERRGRRGILAVETVLRTLSFVVLILLFAIPAFSQPNTVAVHLYSLHTERHIKLTSKTAPLTWKTCETCQPEKAAELLIEVKD